MKNEKQALTSPDPSKLWLVVSWFPVGSFGGKKREIFWLRSEEEASRQAVWVKRTGGSIEFCGHVENYPPKKRKALYK